MLKGGRKALVAHILRTLLILSILYTNISLRNRDLSKGKRRYTA
jgi:hypothetical protein